MVFHRQGIAVVFAGTRDENLAGIPGGDDGNPRRFRQGEELEPGLFSISSASMDV